MSFFLHLLGFIFAGLPVNASGPQQRGNFGRGILSTVTVHPEYWLRVVPVLKRLVVRRMPAEGVCAEEVGFIVVVPGREVVFKL